MDISITRSCVKEEVEGKVEVEEEVEGKELSVEEEVEDVELSIEEEVECLSSLSIYFLTSSCMFRAIFYLCGVLSVFILVFVE